MPNSNKLSAHPRRLPQHRVWAPFVATQVAFNILQWVWPDLADRQTFMRAQVLARNSGVAPEFRSIPEAPRPLAEAWAMQMLVNHDYEDRCYGVRLRFYETAQAEARRRGEFRKIDWPAVYAGLVEWPFEEERGSILLEVQSIVGAALIDRACRGDTAEAEHLAMLTVEAFWAAYDEPGAV